MVERMSGEQAGLTFKYQHPLTKENRSVSLTKAEVAAGMEDTLYEKLVAQFCQCESVGETNVVDCNCDEYIHDFELVADDAEAEQPVSDPVNEFDARFLRSIDSGNGQPGAFSHNSRPSAFNHENYGACGQTPRVYGGYQTSDNRPMSHDFTKARDFNAASAPTPGRAYSDWANKCESAPVTVVGDEPSSRDYPHGESFYRNKDAD
jgi:hypothetical protein